MRLSVLEQGHRGRSAVFMRLLRRLGGGEIDIFKVMHHRPRFFGREFFFQVDETLRKPESSWTRAERELFAGYTSHLNQCPF